MGALEPASAAAVVMGAAAAASATPSSTVAAVTLLVVVASSLLLCILTRRRAPTGIPGPPAYPIVGNVFHIDAHNLPKSFNSLHATYGRVVMLHLGPRVMVSVADSGLAEAIFTSSRGGWSNSDLFRFVFGPLYPRSAIVVEGAEWRRIRRVLHGAVAGGGGWEALAQRQGGRPAPHPCRRRAGAGPAGRRGCRGVGGAAVGGRRGGRAQWGRRRHRGGYTG